MPASPRQINFLRSLVSERADVAWPAGLLDEANTALTGGAIARDLIDRVIAVPRSNGSAAPAARSNGGEPIAPPSAALRPGRMLLAGGIEATATLDSGRHVAVSIRTRKRSGRGWTNAALGEQDSRTNISILGSRVGWLNVDADGRVLLTLRTRREDATVAVRAVLDYAAGMNPAARVQEASRCGRCFRTLTDPVSIDRGIGPECFGRDTGSQHIAAVRVESGDAIVPERMPRTGADAAYAAAGTTAAEVAAENRRQNEAQARHDAAFAARERAQEAAAYEQEMREERASGTSVRPASLVAAVAAVEGRPATETTRARDMIAEALDAYFGEPELSFALGIFDQLAAR